MKIRIRNGLFFLLLATASALFPCDFPYGQEFTVNAGTSGDQVFPTLVSTPLRDVLICWHGPDRDGSGYGFDHDIFGRWIDPDGIISRDEFLVNTSHAGDQIDPVAIALEGGEFVVVWFSRQPDGNVFAQRFDWNGEKTGGEFLVNSCVVDEQQDPIVVALTDGGFVTCWQSMSQDGSDWGCYGQVFDPDGKKRGGEFRINTYTDGLQGDPFPLPMEQGGFVVFWTDGFFAIKGQAFDSTGIKIGDEFVVSPEGGYPNWWLAGATLTDGRIAVFWNRNEPDGYDVYGRLYWPDLKSAGVPFRVNTATALDQWKSAAAARPDGGFIVVWQSDGQDGSGQGIYCQMYDAAGLPEHGEFRVNTETARSQEFPEVASMPDGGFIVCWEGEGADGAGYGIRARYFPAAPVVRGLEPFDLLLPANDATVRTTRCVLSWSASCGTVIFPWEVRYRVFVDEDPEFGSPAVREQDWDTTLVLDNLQPGTTYFWKVLAINAAGDSLWGGGTKAFFVSHTQGADDRGTPAGPDDCRLFQNAPNPFNSSTTIRFDLASAGRVRIVIYDLNGCLVRVLLDSSRTPGEHAASWDGLDASGDPVPSGIYVCRMEVRSDDGERFVRSIKMGLVM